MKKRQNQNRMRRGKPAVLPPRLRRADSFLGIHFDFHAGADSTEVGKNVTPEMVENVIRRVRPDYIQCDCKGHPGISSYPTRVGNPAPGFIGDPLRVWRDATARHGVALYMHYSGVWDSEAAKLHPAWARTDEKGKRDADITSVFGPYVDELLIPQLKELNDSYDVDGIWLDGECWATVHDYGKHVIAAFRAESGLKTVPRVPGDAGFYEFTEFCREGFRSYLRHYVDELHRHAPHFQIASNWAFSSFMPEPVSANVDFISGDYTPQDSVNSARLEGRCMARQGKPWDLMAWSFRHHPEEGQSTKSVVQMQQEAAIVVALGGGFQAYFSQKRDGSISDWMMELMAPVAEFCRSRQAACHRALAVPQIALLLSRAAFQRKSTHIFSPWGGELVPLNGVLHALLEAQNSVEVLSEHHLKGSLSDYPLIVIPEWEYLELGFLRELKAYVRDGGSLLLIGARAAALFEKELGVKLQGEAEEKTWWLEHAGWLAAMKTSAQNVRCGSKARPVGRLFLENDVKGEAQIAASIADYGKGKIAATYLNLGERFLNASNAVARDFLQSLVRQLFPRPAVEITGSHMVDVCLNRVNDRLTLNLVNTAGPHAQTNNYVFDEIPPIGPLQIILRLEKKPRRLTLEPGGGILPFTWSKGEAKLVLPRLEIHAVIVVD